MIGNESLHEISNDNGVRAVKVATSEKLIVKSTMFPHRNIHKFTWTSPDGKTYNQIGLILIDRRWHSSGSILNVRSFRAADCDTVAKFRERLAVRKQKTHRIHMERFDLKKTNTIPQHYCYKNLSDNKSCFQQNTKYRLIYTRPPRQCVWSIAVTETQVFYVTT
jgi:hypothetical protein